MLHEAAIAAQPLCRHGAANGRQYVEPINNADYGHEDNTGEL